MSVPEPLQLPHDAAIEEREWRFPWQQRYLETLARNPNPVLAARLSGISDSRVRQVRGADPDFREAEQDAMRVGRFVPLQIGYQRATTGEVERRTTQVQRFETVEDGERKLVEEVVTTTETLRWWPAGLRMFIEAWHPEFRRGIDHHHLGPDGGPVQHEHAHEVFRLPSRERALELLRLAAEQPAELPLPPGVIDGTATESI